MMRRYLLSLNGLNLLFLLFASSLLIHVGHPTDSAGAECEEMLDVFETNPLLQMTDEYLNCIVRQQTKDAPELVRNLDTFIDTRPDRFFNIAYHAPQAGVTWNVSSKESKPLSEKESEKVNETLKNLVMKSLEQNKDLSSADLANISENIQIRIIGGLEASDLQNKQNSDNRKIAETGETEDERKLAENTKQSTEQDAEPQEKDSGPDRDNDNQPTAETGETEDERKLAENTKQSTEQDAEAQAKDSGPNRGDDNQQTAETGETEDDQKLAENNEQSTDRNDDAQKKGSGPKRGDDNQQTAETGETEDEQKLAENNAKTETNTSQQKPRPGVPMSELKGSLIKKWLEERFRSGDLDHVRDLVDLSAGKAPWKVQASIGSEGQAEIKITVLTRDARLLDPAQQEQVREGVDDALANALQQNSTLTDGQFTQITNNTEIKIRRTERPPNPIPPTVTLFHGQRTGGDANTVQISVELSKPSTQDASVAINVSAPSGEGRETTINIPAGQTAAKGMVTFSTPVGAVLHRKRPRPIDEYSVLRIKGISGGIMPPAQGEQGFVVVLGSGASSSNQTVSYPGMPSTEPCAVCEPIPACKSCKPRFRRW